MSLSLNSAPHPSRILVCLLAAGVVFFLSAPLHAQQADPVQSRLNDVCEIISGKAVQYQEVFDASFLAAVSPAQLSAGVQQLTAMTGPCVEIHVSKRESEFAVKASATTSGNYSIPVSLTVSSEPPFKIVGLFLQTPVKLASTLEASIQDLEKLDGQTSLCIKDITKKKILAAKDTAKSMPIGSTFKLYVLGELARQIATKKHRWDEVVALNRTLFSLPSGTLQTWPNGSPVTVHTLAAMMISQSDNTATDHLLQLLGREAVEQQQFVMGNTHSSANIPFLSTLELFKLKYTQGAAPARIYANAEIESKREQLAELGNISRDSVVFTEKPVLPDQVEWFATTADLCRAMQYLHTVSATQQQVMGILGINRGLSIDKDEWPVVGYKGGSETGVLNFTYYLQRKDGREFVLSASWLNVEHDVSLDQFSAVITGAIRVLATMP